jgi:hypothetical protein
MGPNGQVVLISVYALNYELAESVAQRRVRERVEAGERLLQMAAGRQGDIVVSVTKEVLPSGLVLLSTATSTPDTDPPGFYVQFEWVNPKGECSPPKGATVRAAPTMNFCPSLVAQLGHEGVA